MKPSAPRYQSTITVASLRVADSRIIAGLLLQRCSESEWRQAIDIDNVLQIRRLEAARRLANLLRSRLQLMTVPLWEMVYAGSHRLATQATFAAAVKHSALIGDYLDLVVREKYRLFKKQLWKEGWYTYIEDCMGRDPYMAVWSDSTVSRLRATVHNMLSQVGYVDNARSLRLQTVNINNCLVAYLDARREFYVKRCITVGQ